MLLKNVFDYCKLHSKTRSKKIKNPTKEPHLYNATP